MSELVKLYARPKLNTPNLIAAWPGIANVSLLVAAYLEKKLDFKPLAEIEASRFFDPIGVMVRGSVVEAPQFPESRFLYWKNKNGGSDVILFIGDDQPMNKSYELANCVLDVGARFQVKRIYTLAAAKTRMHHTEQPKVWGVATVPELIAELKRFGLLQRGNLQISGLNGILLGVAKERQIEGICLLGEVPSYASRVENPMAALAILGALSQMLGIEVDSRELAQIATETKEKMKEAAAQAMGEYIDLFTEPIWEQGQEEEGEEGEEN
ncbi:MAG: PAC2 family protein [Chloroflexi bacterium]|nr:PAC2 family protein [Chloroflexota bacterium]